MLLGQLPDLRETQSGKDLIAIGRSEGKVEGKIEGKIEVLLLLLTSRFGEIDPELRRRIESARSAERIERLLVQAITIESVDQLTFER